MRHKLGVPLPPQLLDATLAYPTTTYLYIIILVFKLYFYKLCFSIISLFGINTVAVYIPNALGKLQMYYSLVRHYKIYLSFDSHV